MTGRSSHRIIVRTPDSERERRNVDAELNDASGRTFRGDVGLDSRIEHLSGDLASALNRIDPSMSAFDVASHRGRRVNGD